MSHDTHSAADCTQAREVLLADASVEQLDVLMAGLRPGVEVQLITPQDDALHAMAQVLSDPSLDTLHVLGHGAPGEVILGGQTLNTSALPHLAAQLNVNAFSDSHLQPQICLWSCRTGAAQAGETFMNALANTTQATVFATEQLVGNAAKGGTWNLEKAVAPRRGVPFSAEAVEGFEGVLVSVSSKSWTTTQSGNTAPDGKLSIGETVYLKITFDSSSVNVSTPTGASAPTILLNNGGVATYVGKSGATLIFSYTPSASDASVSTLTTASSNSLKLNGSSVKDGSDTLGSSLFNNLSPNNTQSVDSVAPTSDTAFTVGGDSYINASEVVAGKASLTLGQGGTDTLTSVTVTQGSGSSLVSAVATLNSTTGKYDFNTTGFSQGNLTVTEVRTDLAGNKTSSATTIQLDTVAPTVAVAGETSSNATNTLAKAGDVITTTFTSSDNVTGVTIGGHTAAVTALGNGSYQATYTVAAGDNATSTAVVVNSVDAAGNTNSANMASRVTIDTVAPTVAVTGETSSNATNTLAKVGDVITTTFTSTDNVTGVTIGGHAAAVTALGNGSYQATYTVAAGDNATSTAVVVNSVDAAGNTNSANMASRVTIDTVAPTVAVTGETSSNAINTLAKAGDVITTTFTSSDNVTGVTIGGHAAAVTALGNGTYQATYTVAAGDNATSTAVVVNSVDAAGNTNSANMASRVTIDTVAPGAPTSLTDASPLNNGYATELTQTVTGTAEKGSTVNIIENGAVVGTAVADASTGEFSAQVTLQNRGDNVLSATATDAAGNVSPVADNLTIHVNRAPVVSSALSASTLEGDATFTKNLIQNASDADSDTLTVSGVTYKVDGVTVAAAPAGVSVSNNTLTVDPANAAFDPLAAGETRSIAVSYTVNDGHGGSVTTSETITVTGTNDAPQITNASSALHGAVTEDSTTGHLVATGQLSAVDVDHGATQTWTADHTQGVYGALALDPSTGAWTYTLANDSAVVQKLAGGEQHTESFEVTVSDGLGGTQTQTVVVEVNGTNDKPVLTVSSNTTPVQQGQADGVDLLTASATDIDNPQSDIQFSLGAGAHAPVGGTTYFEIDPSSGHLSLTKAGAAAIAADPVGNWNVEVIASDGHGGTDSKVVHINVQMAVEGNAATLPGSVSAWNIKPTYQDGGLDSNGDPIAIPDGFLATRNGDGAIAVKIPEGVHSLTFDNATVGLNNTGVGVITVGAISDAVVENTHTVTIASDAIGNTTVLLTADSGNISIVGASDSDTGSVLGDGVNFRSDVVNVNAVSADATFVTAADNSHVTMTLSRGGTVVLHEVEAVKFSDGHTVRIVGAGGYATVAEANSNSDVGDTVYVAPLSVTTATGANLGSVVEDATGSGLSAAGQLSARAGTSSGGEITFSVDTAPGVTVSNGHTIVQTEHGTVNIDNASGLWTFALNNSSSAVQSLSQEQVVNDVITVRATDAEGATVTQALNISITGTNDAPVITSSVQEALVQEDGVLSVNGQVTSSDVDHGATAAYSGSAEGSYGTFAVDASTGAWTYNMSNDAHQNLKAGETHAETFTVTVTDDQGDTAQQAVTVTVTGTNDAPVITSSVQAAQVKEDGVLSVNGQVTSSDVDHDATAAFSGNATGTYGTFAVNASTGEWTYNLDNAAHQNLKAGETHTETFTVTVTDDQGAKAQQDVTVTVKGTNDAPVFSSSSVTAQVEQGSSSVQVGSLFTAAATDADAGHVLTYSLEDARGYFTIDSGTGAIGLTKSGAAAIAADPVGNWKLDVKVTDDQGATDSKTITVDVKMAVAANGLSAHLPGSVSDWTFQPASVLSSDPNAGPTEGFLLTRLDDPTIVVKIPHSVTSLSFNNGTVGLNNDGTIGAVTVNAFTDAQATHTITIGTDAVGNAAVVLSANANVSVVGATDSFADKDLGIQNNVRSDTVVIDAESSAAHFVTSQDNKTVTMTIDGGGTVILSEVEAVQFKDHTVRIVGANGYANVAEAQANAGEGDTVYVASLTVDNTRTVLNGNVVEDDSGTAAGQLTVVLPDVAGVGPTAWSIQGATSSSYGAISINAATGEWEYHLNNASTSVQGLSQGATHVDSFVVRAQDQHGAFVEKTVNVTITGVNDGASVSSDAQSVTEADAASALRASGQLVIADADTGEAVVTARDVAGTYGTFHVGADGSWTYTGNGAHDELTAGQQVSDSITVTSKDGTASGSITVKITGANDLATVSSSTTEVREGNDPTALNASGKLLIADADTGEAVVTARDVAGTYGTFHVSADGSWTYTGNGAHNELTAGQKVSDSIVVTSKDGTATGSITVNITGTNDLATVSSAATAVSESNDASSLSAAGQLTITDADAGEVHVVAQSVAGTYGTITVDANGAWTFTANGAHNDLTAGEHVSQSLTVTSQDGTASGVITVNITGTNDAPVLSAATKTVSLVQGAAPVSDVLANIAATDVDGATSDISYSLATPSDLFSINAKTGVISLTKAGAEAVSALAGAGTLPEYSLNVLATDKVGGVSTAETVTVNVNMAVQSGGTTASLPGSMNDWSIAPGADNGFVLTNHADPLIQVTLPGTVTSLNFTAGDSVTLANDGTIGNISYNPGASTGAHTITVAPGTTESTYVALSSGGVTVEGAADTNVRVDGIEIHATVNVNNLNSTFGAVVDNHLTMTTPFGTTVMSDVEVVKFDNARVLVVGAGGYASLTEASAAAQNGDVIYVTDASLATGTKGVIGHTDISIYIANGDNASMSMGAAGMEVRIYGSHAFTLTGSSGNDTIHDYTNISAGMTNTISGGDGNDSIVAHNNSLGTLVLQGEGGNDTLIGGTNAQLLGGDGADTLLALGGAAYLSGGAGNDVLLNAYASADPAAKAVTMIGGAGSDVFGLIGNGNATASGAMKTIVADLGTGDAIDLSFLERVGTNTSITSTADLGAVANNGTSLAKMTTAGTTLDLSTFNATSSEASAGDVNSQVTAGSMSISNATLTKAANAITAGLGAESTIDFNSTFGHLSDTYVQH